MSQVGQWPQAPSEVQPDMDFPRLLPVQVYQAVKYHIDLLGFWLLIIACTHLR